jgi:hypothetical protein
MIMKTNCDICFEEIEDSEVEHCESCGLDGVCSECLADHDCQSDADEEKQD